MRNENGNQGGPSTQALPFRRKACGLALAAALASCAGAVMTPEPAEHAAVVETQRLSRLFERYVDVAGNVDYAAWHASSEDMAVLRAHVEHLLAHPPAADAEPTARLGYWLDLYNGLVLREILERWPISSVYDIPGRDGARGVSARGFFYDLTFTVGDRPMSLLDIETEIVRRRFDDPRAHFALYCGTRSCPLLPASLADGSLERRLDQATRAFVNHGGRVVVDEGDKRIALSPVFGWYERDFVAFVARRTTHPAPSLIDFVAMHADPPLASALEAAREGGYRIELLPYDWRLNEIGAPDDPLHLDDAVTTAANDPLPPLSFPTLDGGTLDLADLRGKVVVIDFWATWCRPCLVSFPHYARLELEYERQGLVVVAVAEDERIAPVRAFAEANRTSIAIALDPDNLAAEAPLSVTTLPTVVVVDRNGVIRYRHEGYGRAELDRIESEVMELLAEPAP